MLEALYCSITLVGMPPRADPCTPLVWAHAQTSFGSGPLAVTPLPVEPGGSRQSAAATPMRTSSGAAKDVGLAGEPAPEVVEPVLGVAVSVDAE